MIIIIVIKLIILVIERGEWHTVVVNIFHIIIEVWDKVSYMLWRNYSNNKMLSDSPLQTQFSFCLKNCWIKCGTKLQNAGDTLQINERLLRNIFGLTWAPGKLWLLEKKQYITDWILNFGPVNKKKLVNLHIVQFDLELFTFVKSATTWMYYNCCYKK